MEFHFCCIFSLCVCRSLSPSFCLSSQSVSQHSLKHTINHSGTLLSNYCIPHTLTQRLIHTHTHTHTHTQRLIYIHTHMQRVPKWFDFTAEATEKFPESIWKFLVYCVTWSWAIYLIRKEDYFFNLKHHWISTWRVCVCVCSVAVYVTIVLPWKTLAPSVL